MSKTTLQAQIIANMTETLDASEQPTASSESERQLKVSALSYNASLNENTTPKINKPPVYKKITLAGSTVTIDLTAAPCLVSPATASRSVDMSGCKVRHAQIKTGATNVGAVTIAPGASNPYPMFGTAKSVILGPGRVEGFGFVGVNGDLPAVAAGVKTIDISGTTGDVVEILLGLGD